MRILFLLICYALCNAVNAQHIRIEPLFGYMHVKQSGNLYVSENNHTPTLYYERIPVSRDFYSAGFGLNCWYSINFGTTGFETFAYGIESGIQITAGSQSKSIERPKERHDWSVRVPLMFGIRTGSTIDCHHGKFGVGLTAGLELFRTALPEESGTFLLPKINLIAGTRRLLIGFHFYPMHITSYYINGEISQRRVSTSIFEFTLRTAINWTPKSYRVKREKNPKWAQAK